MKRRKFFQQGIIGIMAGGVVTLPISCSTQSKKDTMIATDLRTPLCDLLNIQYPIIQAGITDVAGPDQVASISNAGGLGILTATMVPPDILKQRIRQLHELTDKPFGVNLILHNDLFPAAEFEISDETTDKVQSTLNGFRRELEIKESDAKPTKLPPLIQIAFDIIIQ